MPKEAADYHVENFPNDWMNYPEIARETVELGLTLSAEDSLAARKRRDEISKTVDGLLENVDAIIVPTMPVDAPHRDVMSFELSGKIYSPLKATVRYTSLFNQTGHPVVSIPAFLLPDGRSLGIQIIGQRNRDGYLLSVAQNLEQILAISVDYASILARHQTQANSMRQKVS